MKFQTLALAHDSGIATITLNRPDKRNALSIELLEELLAALDEVENSDAQVGILTGAGKAFCAGMDLDELKTLIGKSHAENIEDSRRMVRIFRRLYDFPKPTIAAVNGAAIAGGTGLATMCDFTLAVPGAKFGYTEVRIGFVPAVVSAFLVLQIGEKQARELLLTGRLFTSEEALRLGLVTEVVEVERLEARLLELVAVLKANSPEALAATKRLLRAQNKDWLDAAIAAALAANAEARGTFDFREGVAAFLEKRKPVWGKA